MKHARGWKKRMVIIGIMILSFALLYVVLFRIPLKKALRTNDFIADPNAIVVQYGLGPPTDYFLVDKLDGTTVLGAVELVGEVPPKGYGNEFSMSNSSFVCFIESQSSDVLLIDGMHYDITKYVVTKWVPLYPINRDGALWLWSEKYTCLADLIF